MLDPGIVPFVVVAVELGDPQAAIVLDDGLGTRAAHRGAELEQLGDLVSVPAFGERLIGDDGVSKHLQFCKIQRPVELAHRCRGHLVQSEAQRSRAVVGRVKQIIQLGQIGAAELAAAQRGGLIDPVAELEVEWVERNRVRQVAIGAAIDEAPDRGAAPVLHQLEPTGRDWQCLARKRDVDEAFRSHR